MKEKRWHPTANAYVHARGEKIALAFCLLLSLTFAVYYLATFNSTHASSARSASPLRSPAGDQAGAAADSPTVVVADVSDVVAKALAFKATLSASQQATLEQPYTPTLARRWANLPCGSSCRNGIQFSTLTSAQREAALEVIRAAAGTAANEGYDEFNQIRRAEEALQAQFGGSVYDQGNYFIAFLNTPTTTGAWMLQYGGHHYAANIAYNMGHVVGATPLFEGLEPTTFTAGGTTYSPLEQERAAMRAMLASLSPAQLATAKLAQTFGDVVMTPGQSNGGPSSFPSPKVGLAVSTLGDAQKQLVLAAMAPWTRDMDDTVAANLLEIYESELDGTFVAYTGNGTSGNPGSFLNANTNYARIDGPTGWFEFVCRTGAVFPQIHYHTVWRDRVRDYGADLSLTVPLDDENTDPGDAPVVTGASLNKKKLIVMGSDFDFGAVVLVNGTEVPTTYTSSSGLVAKKVKKLIPKGSTATIQVRNSDGTLSNEFSYTRPT